MCVLRGEAATLARTASPEAVESKVDYRASVAVYGANLVQLQGNLGHLHGLDGKPFGQGANTGGNGFCQTGS